MTNKARGNLYILMAAVLWSTGGILIKFIPVNAIAINGARSLIAFLFFVRISEPFGSNAIVTLRRRLFAWL